MIFHTVRCCICESVLLNLPMDEIEKLDGLTLRCESCDHKLVLNGISVTKAISADPISYFKYDFSL